MYVEGKYKSNIRHIAFYVQATIVAFAAILPLIASNSASALQLTSRKVTIDKSYVGAANNNVSFAFAYTLPTTTSSLQGIVYTFCTTPLGTCTLPTGMVVNAATHTSQTAFPTNATAFATRGGADLGACTSTSTSTILRCFTRTQATTGGGAVTHTIAGITAPTSKQTVYVRIALYSDTSYATVVDTGTVAAAFEIKSPQQVACRSVLTFVRPRKTVHLVRQLTLQHV